jgi:anti-anti-sigma factor
VALVWQASNPAVYELVRKPGTAHFRRRSEEHPEDETIPGLLMVRVEGRLFFANSETVHEQLTRLVDAGGCRVLALDCSSVIDLEYSAVKMLMEAEKSTGRRGTELWLAGLNPTVRTMVERSPLGRQVGPERIFHTLGDVVDRYPARKAGG